MVLVKILLEREHEWNPSVDQDRPIKYKTIVNTHNRKNQTNAILAANGIRYKERVETIDLVDLENMTDSKLVKISSYEDQKTREMAIVGLKNGTKQVLVSTNVCSRGLDLPNIDCVINYTMPEWHDGKAYEGLGRANNDILYRYM